MTEPSSLTERSSVLESTTWFKDSKVGKGSEQERLLEARNVCAPRRKEKAVSPLAISAAVEIAMRRSESARRVVLCSSALYRA